jgi:hypothetical protein
MEVGSVAEPKSVGNKAFKMEMGFVAEPKKCWDASGGEAGRHQAPAF